MISYTNSSWGIKRSNHNITSDIMSIISNANDFIIVGGYNFTFKTAGYTFFGELRRKALRGIPTLIILPSYLYVGGSNTQTNIINFCRSNGIGIILNGNNHSKWILTDNDLYYGSSNFSETSWTKKVEVVTIHNHSKIAKQWKIDTIKDFKSFVQEEILSIPKRSVMTRMPILIRYTRIVWNTIKHKMLRLNPSIEKVKTTLNNYEDVVLDLQNICSLWFETEQFENFERIREFSHRIHGKVDDLCSFAYTNIYNETIQDDDSNIVQIDKKIIEDYNQYHLELINTIEECISTLESNLKPIALNIESKNQIIINRVNQALNSSNYN